MIKDTLRARVEELAKEIQKSLENHQCIRTALENATNAHNALVGRYDEAVALSKKFEEEENNAPAQV